jgi:sporulation protein YlmC with PRC-barrel domain
MSMTGAVTLSKLGDSEMTIATPSVDLRGMAVKDKDGNEIGKVDDLLIDDSDHKVRFMQIESGGFLGMGATESFVPVDAITRVTDGNVYIDLHREHVAGAPHYEPDVAQRDFYGGLYDYYGYAPFWEPGYTYPDYPYYRG